jgi:hypothetical protein
MSLSSALPAPSSLNFLAGLFAGAGINMLTSVSTGPPGGTSTAKVGLDSFLWVFAAGFLTWAARILENAERDAQLVFVGHRITEEEKREILESYRRKAGPRVQLAIGLTVVSVVAAILLLPGLISWRPLLGAF